MRFYDNKRIAGRHGHRAPCATPSNVAPMAVDCRQHRGVRSRHRPRRRRASTLHDACRNCRRMRISPSNAFDSNIKSTPKYRLAGELADDIIGGIVADWLPRAMRRGMPTQAPIHATLRRLHAYRFDNIGRPIATRCRRQYRAEMMATIPRRLS